MFTRETRKVLFRAAEWDGGLKLRLDRLPRQCPEAELANRLTLGYDRPSSRARATASVRLWTWSLPKILRLCPFTVSSCED